MTPVSRRVAWPVYRWVHNRGRLPGGRPATEMPDVPPAVKGIRRRRPKDLGQCARLLRMVFAEGQYPVHWPDSPRAWLEDQDVIDAWVLERRGEILGHVAVSKVGTDRVSRLRWREVTGRDPSELAGVSRLFVRPQVLGQGVGSGLLDVAVAEIRSRGLVPVLDVVSASKDAIELYEARGWRRIAMYPWGDKAEDLQIFYYAAPPEGTGR